MLQKPRFFAISPRKVDFKKSVKYIFSPELTIKRRRQLAEARRFWGDYRVRSMR
jgi:hypothetical protein